MTTPEIVRFNLALLSYADDSWLAALADGDLLIKLRGRDLSCPRTNRRLSGYLLRKLGLHGRYCVQFDGALEQLALREPLQLEKWVLYLGVTLNAARIQQAVARDQVLAIKQALGEPAYQFALKRAPHLTPLPPIRLPTQDYSEDFYRRAVACGMAAVNVAYSGCETALTERLRLKLPLSWSETAAPELFSPTPVADTKFPGNAHAPQPQPQPHPESRAAAAFCERVAVELEMLDKCA